MEIMRTTYPCSPVLRYPATIAEYVNLQTDEPLVASETTALAQEGDLDVI